MTWHADIRWPIEHSIYKRRFSAIEEAEAMAAAEQHIEYLHGLYSFNPSLLQTLSMTITKEENEMDKLIGKEVMFIKFNGYAVTMLVTGLLGSIIMGEDEGEHIQINTDQIEDYLVMEEA